MVDLAHQELFRAKVGKGGIILCRPQKISTKFSYPKNIHFSENRKKYLNSKV